MDEEPTSMVGSQEVVSAQFSLQGDVREFILAEWPRPGKIGLSCSKFCI